MRLFLSLWFTFAAVTCGLCEISMNLDKIKINFYNESYASDPMIDVSTEKNSAIINGKVKTIKDLDMNVKVDVQVYELVNGAYMIFPMSLNLNACEEIDKNSFGIKDLLINYSNGPAACPLKKGDYHLKNAVIDFSKFPSEIPAGSYKVIAKIYNNEDYVAELEAFGSVKGN